MLSRYQVIACGWFVIHWFTTQDPKEADPMMRVQNDLDETKIVLVSYLSILVNDWETEMISMKPLMLSCNVEKNWTIWLQRQINSVPHQKHFTKKYVNQFYYCPSLSSLQAKGGSCCVIQWNYKMHHFLINLNLKYICTRYFTYCYQLLSWTVSCVVISE